MEIHILITTIELEKYLDFFKSEVPEKLLPGMMKEVKNEIIRKEV